MQQDSFIPENIEFLSPSGQIWASTSASILETDKVGYEFTRPNWDWSSADNGTWTIRLRSAAHTMPLGNSGAPATPGQYLGQFLVNLPPVGVAPADYFHASNRPSETLISEGGSIDSTIHSDVTWKIAGDGATTKSSNTYQIKTDGTEVFRGGVTNIPADTDQTFSANIDGAWEQDVTYVHMVTRTKLDFPDGSVSNTEVHWFKYREPSNPFSSYISTFVTDPIYESDDVEITVSTDHIKTADDRYMQVGPQRYQLATGGTITTDYNLPAGEHEAYVYASYKDGTESKSDVIILTVVGGINPATTAQLQQAVKDIVYSTMLGPQGQTMQRINATTDIGYQAALIDNNWAQVGDARAAAYEAERIRWQAIMNNPDTSPELYAVADSGVQAMTVMRDFGSNEANNIDEGDYEGFQYYREANIHMWNQYLGWTQGMNGDPLTSPFILSVPSK